MKRLLSWWQRKKQKDADVRNAEQKLLDAFNTLQSDQNAILKSILEKQDAILKSQMLMASAISGIAGALIDMESAQDKLEKTVGMGNAKGKIGKH